MPPQTAAFFEHNFWFLVFIALWSIPWKGAALWRAARTGSLRWFVVLLVVNTAGFLEILYILYFSRPKTKKPDAHKA